MRGLWTSTIWGLHTGCGLSTIGGLYCIAPGVELITGWECGVKKNILVERRGTFLGDICKEYDITATKHRPISYILYMERGLGDIKNVRKPKT